MSADPALPLLALVRSLHATTTLADRVRQARYRRTRPADLVIEPDDEDDDDTQKPKDDDDDENDT